MPDDDPNAIRDSRFTNQLSNLTSLKTLLLTQAVPIREEDVPLLAFGALTQLRYNEKGRLPTVEEWEQLDRRSQTLFSYLGDDLRKRFELSQTANLIAGLSILFIILAFLFLGIATLADNRNVLFGLYGLWTGFLGAIGAIAFISMNALSIQSDVTFDLTNHSLLAVRILLGSLFGIVLSIPFGFESFVRFCESITRQGPDISAANGVAGISLQAVLLVLPFILGFSTSLVILVLNRLVESIAVFFGERRGSDGRPSTKTKNPVK